MRGRGAWPSIAAAALGVAGCSGACGRHAAEVIEVVATVEGSRAAAAWAPAAPGERFGVGDALRTGPSSGARIELAGGARLRIGADTLVRFAAGQAQDSRYRLGVETGEAELEGGATGARVETAFGVARLEGGTRLRLVPLGEHMRFEVIVGRAKLEGSEVELTGGRGIVVEIGGAVVDTAAEPPARPAQPADGAPPGGAVAGTVTGAGAEVRDPGAEEFRPLPPGDARPAAGATVRLPQGTTLELRRGDEHAVVRGAAEVVVAPADGVLVRATDGQVDPEVVKGEVAVEVPGGAISVRASGDQPGAAEVTVQDGGATVRARQGAVEVRGRDGVHVLAPGESARVGPDGALELPGRGPSQPDFSIAAGESAIIHDPRPPTAIRVRFDGVCAGEGQVALEGASRGKQASTAQGAGGALVLVPAGTHPYRVRCAGAGGGASGTLRVVRDEGAARLPARAPHNTLDADGRRYSVLYQNHLPALSMRWPGAPAAAGYALHVTGSPRERTVRTKQASHTFASGAIPEGMYTWWFEADGGGGRSPDTTLKLDFDNAAPAATVSEPKDGGAWGGARVRVAGVAVVGSTVSVGSEEVALDGHQRFAQEVAVAAGETAVAVRVAHPDRLVHYYLRRRGGRP